MREVSIRFTEDQDIRVLKIRPTTFGGVIIEEYGTDNKNRVLACPCCIDKDMMEIIKSAAKALGLHYLLLPKGWDHGDYKNRLWMTSKIFKFVEVPDTNGMSEDEIVSCFDKAEEDQLREKLL